MARISDCIMSLIMCEPLRAVRMPRAGRGARGPPAPRVAAAGVMTVPKAAAASGPPMPRVAAAGVMTVPKAAAASGPPVPRVAAAGVMTVSKAAAASGPAVPRVAVAVVPRAAVAVMPLVPRVPAEVVMGITRNALSGPNQAGRGAGMIAKIGAPVSRYWRWVMKAPAHSLRCFANSSGKTPSQFFAEQ
jgi:hypothetical protein